MRHSIRQELINHVIETITERELENLEDLHFHAFNEDYYIIGYYQASEWLKKHNISAWDAFGTIVEWEDETLGEVQIKPEMCNEESITNMYVYILGEELLSEFNLDQEPSELLIDLKDALQ